MPNPLDDLSPAANALVVALLSADPAQRPGCTSFDELAHHTFFHGVEWEAMLDMPPPFVPRLGSESDATFFVEDETEGQEPPSFESLDDVSLVGDLGGRTPQHAMPFNSPLVNVQQLVELTMACASPAPDL